MYSRIISFVAMNATLFNGHFGFRKGLSTYMAVLEMCDKISKAKDRNHFSIGVFFLPISKAFDTVSHDILLKKLEHYGIRDMCLTWVRNYLNDRGQCVHCNGSTSCMLTINCGVPQGSILYRPIVIFSKRE